VAKKKPLWGQTSGAGNTNEGLFSSGAKKVERRNRTSIGGFKVKNGEGSAEEQNVQSINEREGEKGQEKRSIQKYPKDVNFPKWGKGLSEIRHAGGPNRETPGSGP